MSKATSPAQELVDLICASYLREFTDQEVRALDNLGGRDESGCLPSSARIAVRGSQSKMIVSSPSVLFEGLIRFYTPTLPDASCLLPLSVIEGVYFND